MTTYNTLTITNTTAAPVHLGMMLTALEQHAGWTAEVTEFDGEPLAHDIEWHRPEDGPAEPAILRHQVSASWHNKYSFTFDGKPWADLTTFLGPDYRLQFTQEWDDDGIGRTQEVW